MADTAATPIRTRERRWTRDTWAAWGFLSPALLGFAVFIFVPILAVIVLSFFDWGLLGDPEFIGVENFRRLAGDNRIRDVYASTAFIAFASVVLNLLLGLIIAVLLESRLPQQVRNLFRVTYVFPYIVSASAVALIWRFLLNKDLGLVNYFLGVLGIDSINWLGTSFWSPISVVLVYTWKSLGFSILIYVAGLQSIPQELREAARLDGANVWHMLTKLTLPLLSPTIFFLVVINTINAFQMYAEPKVLTGGGPGDSSRTIVLYIYDLAFRFFDLGYASTVALTLFIVLLGLTAIQFRLSRRWTFYG